MPAIRVAPYKKFMTTISFCVYSGSVCAKVVRFTRTSTKHDRALNGDADGFATAAQRYFSENLHFSLFLFDFKCGAAERED